MQHILRLAADLKHEQQTWWNQSPVELQQLTRHIHGPLWKHILAMANVEADGFLSDLQNCFPLVGHLPACEGRAAQHCFQTGITVNELRAQG